MKIVTVPGEGAVVRRAETWLSALDDAYGRAGVNHADPAAAPLKEMDRDLRVWEAAVRKGLHSRRSLGAAHRVLRWLTGLEDMQAEANRRHRTVTRRLG